LMIANHHAHSSLRDYTEQASVLRSSFAWSAIMGGLSSKIKIIFLKKKLAIVRSVNQYSNHSN
jgi:uncharacterized membrane protein